ncbi:MAG TPA: MMPL family transporter [Acidimicrobiia bacterium]|nr:MMPL family transporter [Acidimicrobiia bacterium]
MSSWLDRLGRRAVRHRWWFIAAWVLIAVSAFGFAKGLDGKTIDAFRIPGAQSQEAIDLLTQKFPSQSGSSATVVFSTTEGITDPSVEPAIQESLTALGEIPNVTSVTDPYGPLSVVLVSDQGALKGKIAMVTVQFADQVQELQTDVYEQMQAAVAPAVSAGVQVEFGGAVTDYADQPPKSNADLIGLLATVVILLFAFGSVIAMGLPIVTALFGLAVGLSLITVVAAFTDIGTLAPVLGTMIGLGVGIDYSLFIVTRYREGLASGMGVEEAVGRSVATAGSAVLFAGCTVVIAICGLAVSGIPYVARLGYMAGIVVAVMMLAATTLLPAIIGVIGHRIDKWQVHFGRRRDSVAGSVPERQPGAASSSTSVWARWSRTVASHAWPFAILGVVILVTLAWPLLSMRLGESDDGNLPSSTTQRQAYDLIAAGFGPGTNGPLLVVVELPEANDTTVTDAISSAVKATPGVDKVMPPELNSPTDDVALIAVFPTTAPDSAATASLVSTLRDDVLPKAVGTSGATAYVGGVTAEFIDIGNQISDRLPYFIGAVVLLSFLLLMLVFHSVLIPLTAAVMNLLSVAAAYGAIVAVFQWGWGKDLIGLESTVPIVSFVPMMMFAVLFGLSMDYQVFLLTRIREEYDNTGDTREAVVLGLTRTARVITSAALIMICVFGAFVLNFSAEVKMFGLGLAFAVFVDATVVRMMLVPSLMEILGDANWWFPKWLDWLPRLDIDGPTPPAPDDVSPEAPALVRSGGR